MLLASVGDADKGADVGGGQEEFEQERALVAGFGDSDVLLGGQFGDAQRLALVSSWDYGSEVVVCGFAGCQRMSCGSAKPSGHCGG